MITSGSKSANDSSGLPPWFVILNWMFLGSSMIIFNKVILSTWNFNFPFFLTAWHCFVATVLTQLMSYLSPNSLPGVAQAKVTRSMYFFKILPMAVCFAFSLSAGNIAYTYISVTYIQMLKSFTPVPMLFMSVMTGREAPSIVLASVVFMISSGVAMASVGEAKFSIIGFFLQLSAVLADVTRTTLIDLTMADIKLDSLSLLYYLMPPSLVLITMAHIAFEWQHFPLDHIIHSSFRWILVVNGMLAFSLNISSVLLIKYTSPVTMAVSGIVKDILLVLSATIIFQTQTSSLQIVGYSISILGISFFRAYRLDPSIFENILTFIKQYACRHGQQKTAKDIEMTGLLDESSDG